MKILSLMLLLLVSTNVFAFSLFGPKNYDECVLENMKGVSSDTAAHIINRVCRDKFKKNEIPIKREVKISSDSKLKVEEDGIKDDKRIELLGAESSVNYFKNLLNNTNETEQPSEGDLKIMEHHKKMKELRFIQNFLNTPEKQ